MSLKIIYGESTYLGKLNKILTNLFNKEPQEIQDIYFKLLNLTKFPQYDAFDTLDQINKIYILLSVENIYKQLNKKKEDLKMLEETPVENRMIIIRLHKEILKFEKLIDDTLNMYTNQLKIILSLENLSLKIAESLQQKIKGLYFSRNDENKYEFFIGVSDGSDTNYTNSFIVKDEMDNLKDSFDLEKLHQLKIEYELDGENLIHIFIPN